MRAFQTVDEAEEGKILLRVLNKGFLKEEVIGVYEFDASFIYLMDKHTMFNQWLALSNPEAEDFNEITSYLKVSLSIACVGDEQVQLAEDRSPPKETDTVMMPPSVRRQYK